MKTFSQNWDLDYTKTFIIDEYIVFLIINLKSKTAKSFHVFHMFHENEKLL